MGRTAPARHRTRPRRSATSTAAPTATTVTEASHSRSLARTRTSSSSRRRRRHATTWFSLAYFQADVQPDSQTPAGQSSQRVHQQRHDQNCSGHAGRCQEHLQDHAGRAGAARAAMSPCPGPRAKVEPGQPGHAAVAQHGAGPPWPRAQTATVSGALARTQPPLRQMACS